MMKKSVSTDLFSTYFYIFVYFYNVANSKTVKFKIRMIVKEIFKPRLVMEYFK